MKINNNEIEKKIKTEIEKIAWKTYDIIFDENILIIKSHLNMDIPNTILKIAEKNGYSFIHFYIDKDKLTASFYKNIEIKNIKPIYPKRK
ncbi:MAG: hypothetical protein ACYDAO_10050 [Thermoplasmataceae archaeon]